MATPDMYVKAIRHEPQHIKCSLIDQLVGNIPVTVVFFYKQKINPETLRSALQSALSGFPLFAGIIEFQDDAMYINCNNKGVAFSVARHDKALAHVLSRFADGAEGKSLYDTIDMADAIQDQSAVLTIKVNLFTDGGMCLGICWHHAVGDMHTFMRFMKAFSDTVAGAHPDDQPLIVQNRASYLDDNLKENGNDVPSIRYLEDSDLHTYMSFKAKDKIMLRFYFSQDELHAMKEAFIEKSGAMVSTNDVLCAHMFSIIAESDPRAGSRNLSIAVNFRMRMGLPDSLLGNMVASANICCQAQQKPADVAKDIRGTINGFSQHGMPYFANKRFIAQNGGRAKISRIISKGLDPVRGTLLVTNWSKFGVYELDFGEEAPFYFTAIGSAPFPWISMIAEGFFNEGLIFSAGLPTSVADKLLSEDILQSIHRYRDNSTALPELARDLDWIY